MCNVMSAFLKFARPGFNVSQRRLQSSRTKARLECNQALVGGVVHHTNWTQ